MIEVIMVVIDVGVLAYCSFQLNHHQRRAQLIKARQDNDKYRTLLKMKPRHACDVCGNGQPVGEDVDATTIDNCGNCRKCYKGREIAPGMFALDRMLVCPECGNKRCPKASDHRLACTNSNEPNQLGSVY